MINVSNVYITNSRNNTVALPVAPESVQVNYETADSTSTVIGKGEINRIGDIKLRQIEIKCYLPLDSSHITYATVHRKHRWKLATSYLTFFQNIFESKKACRLVITGTNITLRATLNYTYGMENSNAQEYMVDLKFTEHIPIKARKLATRHKRAIKHGKRRGKPSHKISRNSKVMVTGKVYHTSNAKTGKAIRNMKCVITAVAGRAKHRYHVKSVAGKNLGWIDKGAIK
jgi:hypothetical protein